MGQGLVAIGGGPAVPHYSNGPYTWDQYVTFTAGVSGVNTNGSVLYVDGTNGADGNNGKSWTQAKETIQAAVTAAAKWGTVFVAPKDITDFTGDPANYAEAVTIPATHFGLTIEGLSRGRTQGGLPQIKLGSTSNPLITIQAAGCLIKNMGLNGSGSTGGGILLDDDYSAKTAFGTTIQGCHIKNCIGSTATSGKTGGGIQWSAEGNAWQCNIIGNKFYKNASDILLKGTSNTRPQDILVQGNIFQSSVASSCDANIVDATQGGFQTIVIDNNNFGALPALGSGTILRWIDLTGTQHGILSNNTFGTISQPPAKTFGATGDGARIPTTVDMIRNYGETDTEGDNGLIFRT